MSGRAWSGSSTFGELYLFVEGSVVVLVVAVFRVAVGQLSEPGVGEGQQLLADAVVLPSVGEVDGRVSAVRQRVGVGARPQQQTHQRRVLRVHRQVQRRAPVTLLLVDRRATTGTRF